MSSAISRTPAVGYRSFSREIIGSAGMLHAGPTGVNTPGLRNSDADQALEAAARRDANRSRSLLL
jgi:hypothetical protein